MADLSELFVASWGDIRLFISSINWDAGRTQVVHDLASGDDHPVQDRGKRTRKARCTLIFDDFDGSTESPQSAFRRFQAQVDDGKRRIFTHPMEGSFFAVVGDFEPTINESSVTTATCEFIPDGQVQPVAPAGAGTTGTSGEGAISQASDELDKQLSDVGLGFPPGIPGKIKFGGSINANVTAAFDVDASLDVSVSANVSASGSVAGSASASASGSVSADATASASAFAFADAYASAAAEADATAIASITATASASAFAFSYASAALSQDVRTSVERWNQEDVAPRVVAIDAARLSESIATMIELGGFENDLQLWPAFRAAIMLGETVRSAAIAATSETPSVFVMRVLNPTALLTMCARIYGGRDAEERTRQVAGLNDIRTQGWLDPGDYLMPARPTDATTSVPAVF